MAQEIARRLRPSSLDEVKEDYNDLKLIACNKAKPLARTGLTVLDHYFLQYRIKAKTKQNISFYEALQNKEIVEYLHQKVEQLKPTRRKNTEDRVLRLQYDMFQLYFGTINQFRPTEAMKLYCLLKPKLGILDFSAGWGGRCLAAMALNVPYIGIDANDKLEKPYRDMIDMAKPESKVTMIFKPAEKVDISKYKYDLIFTSPPYFMLEMYEKMPSYESKVVFLDTFFRPVIEKAWANLASGGHLALNMPVEMYNAVKACLAPLKKKIELALADRHPGIKKEYSTEPAYKEYTYVWKKTSRNKTLKCKRGSLTGGKRKTLLNHVLA
jgi:hypothetical protein